MSEPGVKRKGGRVGIRTEDGVSPLDGAINDIRRYLCPNNDGDSIEAFTEVTRLGLLVGVAGKKHMVSPFSGDGTDTEPLTVSGLYSFDELKACEIRTPQPVIEGLIYGGETDLLAGRPKVGKSRLVHQMALCIVTGTPFLGMEVPRPRSVLIVDLENRPWAIRDRLIRMAGADGEARGLYVWCAESLSADEVNTTQDGIAKLRSLLDQCRAEVLIIDPWRLFLGKDENNAEEIVKGLRAVSSLREFSPGITIIIVHHVRKERFETPRNLLADPRLWADSVSGHHALSSHVDACLGLERQRDPDSGEKWIIFGGIARNTEPRTLLLEDDEDTLRFEVCRNETALETVLTQAEKAIWHVAYGMTKKYTFTELLKKAATTNRKAVSRMLKKAEAHGLILRSPGGAYETIAPKA